MSEVRHATDPISGQQVTIKHRLVDRLRGKYAVGPTLPNGEPEFGYRQFPAVLIQDEAAAEIERLRDVGESALSWLDRWAMHVGRCPADENCTCGLGAIRHELALALNPQL